MRARPSISSLSSFALSALLLCPLPALAQEHGPEPPVTGARPRSAGASRALIAAPPEGEVGAQPPPRDGSERPPPTIYRTDRPIEVKGGSTPPTIYRTRRPDSDDEDRAYEGRFSRYDYRSEGFAEGDHFEATMGFLVGQRSYEQTSFKFDGGDAASIGGGGLVEPFNKAPFTNATVLGLRYDVRVVMSYIRMTVGFDLPFPMYDASDAQGTYTVGGAQRLVMVQSLSTKELRFGLGGEYPIKSIAPFADLIGGVHWVSSDLSIDGHKATYSATSFAFSVRGGLRAHVRRWFFAAASIEAGLIGDITWNGEVSVGFSLK